MRRFVLGCCYSGIILGSVLVSIIPDVYHIRIAPIGTTFPLIHNSIDYYSYLSEMKSGYDGKWLISYRGTPEHNRPIFIYTFFVVLGQLARIAKVSLPWMYFFSRIVFGIGLLISCLWLIRKIFKESLMRVSALFLVAVNTGFWKLGSDKSIYHVNQFLGFWSHFDPIARTTFLPHHLISHMCGVFTIGLVVGSITTGKKRYALLAGILGIIAAIFYHGTMTNLLGAWAILLPIWFFILMRKSSLKIRVHALIPFGIFFVLTALSLAYMLSLTYTVWPWTLNGNLAARLFFTIPFWEYIAVLGPTFILTLIGIPRILKSSLILPKFLLCWAIFPFFGIYILAYIFPQWSNMPYLEATSYIPLSILAVYGIQTIASVKPFWKNRLIVIMLVLLTIYFIPAHLSSFFRIIESYHTLYYNEYFPDAVMEGFSWLDTNTKDGSTVLSGGYMGMPLIAFTHNYVVYASDLNTYKSGEKISDLLAFFSQKDPEAGKRVLKKYQVEYVFYSYDTDAPEESYVSQLPLTETYRNGRVVIYRVNH